MKVVVRCVRKRATDCRRNEIRRARPINDLSTMMIVQLIGQITGYSELAHVEDRRTVRSIYPIEKA